MEAKSIKHMSGDNWVSLLEKAAGSPVGQDQRAHTYLYLNKNKQINHFETPEEAHSFKYNKELSSKKVIKLAEKRLKEYKVDTDEAKQLRIAIDKFKLNHEIKIVKEKKISSLARKFLSPEKIMKREVNAQQIDTEYISLILAHASEITQSARGTPGVIFIDSDLEGRLVVKPSLNPVKEVGAERFFNFMGFITPHTKVVAQESKLGEQIFQVIDEKRVNLDKRASEQVEDMINPQKAPYFLVMEFLNATPFEQLLPNRIEDTIRNPEFLQRLGEMVLLDQFTGNRDRLSKTGCNTGNFLIDSNNELALIDSEIDTNTKSVETTIPELLMVGGEKPIAEYFLTMVTERYHPEIGEDHLGFICENFAMGIKKAAESLMEVFQNKELVFSFTEIQNLFSREVNGDILIDRLAIIEKALQSSS